MSDTEKNMLVEALFNVTASRDALRAELAAEREKNAIGVTALKYAATCGAINYAFVIRREAEAALDAIAVVKVRT